jgi:putative selenium metabolism hydrolase
VPTDSARSDQSLTDFTCALVRLRSVLGDESNVAERVSREMRGLLFDHVEIDDAGNAVGVIRGLREGPAVLLDAHMDTVDVVPEDAWSRDPFGGELVDDRIHGRGSSDMKGALAAMVYAAAGLERSALAGSVIISSSVGEESVEGAALRTVMARYDPDFVVIGEASGLDLVRAGRGRAEFTIETVGRPAHASNPERGINAVHRMAGVIGEVEKIAMPEDPFVGRGVMCLTDIVSVPYPAHSVVPSGCCATYERRLLPGEVRETVEAQLVEACARADAPDTVVCLATTDYRTYTGLRWIEPKWFSPWEMAESHALVQGGLRGLRAAGLDPQLTSYQFCTNGAYSAGVAGVPTIGFGPSTEQHAHVIDEFLDVDQLLSARDGYAGIISTLLDGSAS